jgi:bacterioferritin-associated ferredoxin
MHRVHHQLERGVDEAARLFRVEVLDQIHRTLDIGKQSGDCLTLALETLRFGAIKCHAN